MERMIDENVAAAFDLLLQEMFRAVDGERGCGADAFRRGDYGEADMRKQRCRRIENFAKEAAGLKERWTREMAQPESDAGKVAQRSPQTASGLRMTMAYNRVQAVALYQGGQVVLLEGSTVRSTMLASLAGRLRELRTRYEAERVLVPDARSDLLKVARSIRFDSPSAAAQFVAGCSVSGNRDWHVEGDGRPLGKYLREERGPLVAAPHAIAQPVCVN